MDLKSGNLLSEEIFLVRDESSLKNKLLFEALAGEVNHLITTDFEKLISLLYRLDVNETKLRELLQKNKIIDAANIISTLIIERQLEKIRSRREYRQDPDNINEADKW